MRDDCTSLHSVTSPWWCEISYDGSIYIMEISKCFQSRLPPPSAPPPPPWLAQSQSFNIYQHTTEANVESSCSLGRQAGGATTTFCIFFLSFLSLYHRQQVPWKTPKMQSCLQDHLTTWPVSHTLSSLSLSFLICDVKGLDQVIVKFPFSSESLQFHGCSLFPTFSWDQ